MRVRLAPAALALLAAACGPAADPPGGPGIAGGPPPPSRGRALALSATAVIDVGGGAVSLSDPATGQAITVTVPQGAVSGPTTFTLETISSTAPDGIGSAFRISPPVQLTAPMTLTWTMPPATTVDQVTAQFQDGSGYWFRVYVVSRDVTAQELSTQTSFAGDWTLAPLASARDLHGPFRLDSTESVPMTATGDVTLQWVGDDAAFAYYIPQGDITLATPLASGSATCNPDTPPTQALPFSVAEIRNLPIPVQFRWGLNGRWDLTCSDGSRTYVSTDFDSLGITNIGCARTYLGTAVIDATHVQGQYLIDCTAEPGHYRVVASWDLVLPAATPGPLPPPPAPWP